MVSFGGLPGLLAIIFDVNCFLTDPPFCFLIALNYYATLAEGLAFLGVAFEEETCGGEPFFELPTPLKFFFSTYFFLPFVVGDTFFM